MSVVDAHHFVAVMWQGVALVASFVELELVAAVSCLTVVTHE